MLVRSLKELVRARGNTKTSRRAERGRCYSDGGPGDHYEAFDGGSIRGSHARYW